MNELLKQDWYVDLINDCIVIIVRGTSEYRWALIEMYHQLGHRILTENDNFERKKIYGREIVQRVAQSLGKAKRSIYYSVQFAKKYPDITSFPEGKNVAWRDVVHKYLPEPKKLEPQIILEPLKGTYNVIVIDPPWEYGELDFQGRRGAAPYPTMPMEAIKAIDLPAADDCVLWLWVTNRFLREGFECLDSWCFAYKNCFTWVKHAFGVGNWGRGQTEHILLAVKGSPKVDFGSTPTAVFGKRREHSRKPDDFYQMVEATCIGKKLDYFGRQQRQGWEVYGNEPDKF